MGCGDSKAASASSPSRAQQQPQPQKQKPVGTVPPQTKKKQEEDEEKTEIKMKPVKMNKKILLRYVELEKETRKYENKNILKAVTLKKEQLENLEQLVKQMDTRHKELRQQTAKEKADVDNMQQGSVKNFFKNQQDYDAQLSKEQEEYLDALNREEIAKKELDGVTKQRAAVNQELKELQKGADKLAAIYKEQDELLASIFNGKYGSELEYKLETELDMYLDRKQRVGVARYKWHNARVLLHHACNQLGFAVKKWEEVPNIQKQDSQARYKVATEARNNLVAANSNITSAQRYLNTIQFPYCKQDEMATLTKATSNIYTDMQTTERHAHALNCYSVTYKRAAALLQWFDQVIDKTIAKDLEDATKKADQKGKELRAERLRLIKEKIKNEIGEDIDIDVDNDADEGEEAVMDEKVADLAEADKVDDDDKQDKDQVNKETGEEQKDSGPAPLPLNELAPPPSNEDIFGDIDNLKKEHEKDMQDYQKAQEINKARMEQGLQEKLRARKSRRQRQMKHDQEKNNMS